MEETFKKALRTTALATATVVGITGAFAIRSYYDYSASENSPLIAKVDADHIPPDIKLLIQKLYKARQYKNDHLEDAYEDAIHYAVCGHLLSGNASAELIANLQQLVGSEMQRFQKNLEDLMEKDGRLKVLQNKMDPLEGVSSVMDKQAAAGDRVLKETDRAKEIRRLIDFLEKGGKAKMQAYDPWECEITFPDNEEFQDNENLQALAQFIELILHKVERNRIEGPAAIRVLELELQSQLHR